MNMNKRILIATSNDDHRFLLSVLLTDAGYEVDAPKNLEICPALFEQYDYYKVILDYDYRVKANRMFCSYLETQRQFRKSVLIQALTDEDIMTKVFEQGGFVVNKPYDTEKLLLVVNSS